MSAVTQTSKTPLSTVALAKQSLWFHIPKPVADPALRLFCFPYAGGSASIYHDWVDLLPANVELCAIQLPGRGNRFKEAAFTSMTALVDDLIIAITPLLDTPYGFFGHSMGAQIAFEMSRRVAAEGIQLPRCLVVSGRKAPQMPPIRKPIHQLPEAEFLREIERLNGTPQEALSNPELMALVSPILRADCELIETLQYVHQEPLAVPLVAVGGTKDRNVTIEALEAWSAQTQSSFEMQLFSGDHFFIHSARDALVGCLSKYLITD